MLPSYAATFSVPMTCDACVQDIKSALSSLPGIKATSFSISKKLVEIKGTEPPSKVIAAIQSTGRAAILRGSGQPDSAAVCILETPPLSEPYSSPLPSPVRGLVRLIELSQDHTMLDITLTGLVEGLYQATVRQSGDISQGKASVGPTFTGLECDNNGILGEIEVDHEGRGNLVGEIYWRVSELVGRGIMVEEMPADSTIHTSQDGDRLVLGVIARSAGIWENEKVVCGCSGKTVWEERQDMISLGMV